VAKGQHKYMVRIQLQELYSPLWFGHVFIGHLYRLLFIGSHSQKERHSD
jgi:hypothetical protein